MFLLYSNQGVTSDVEPGVPELLIGFLQFPIYGWFIARSFRNGKEMKVLIRLGLWHLIAIIAAILSSMFLHHVWFYGGK
jgi:hypothetical protein